MFTWIFIDVYYMLTFWNTNIYIEFIFSQKVFMANFRGNYCSAVGADQQHNINKWKELSKNRRGIQAMLNNVLKPGWIRLVEERSPNSKLIQAHVTAGTLNKAEFIQTNAAAQVIIHTLLLWGKINKSARINRNYIHS
jgi:hypothetical protein